MAKGSRQDKLDRASIGDLQNKIREELLKLITALNDGKVPSVVMQPAMYTYISHTDELNDIDSLKPKVHEIITGIPQRAMRFFDGEVIESEADRERDNHDLNMLEHYILRRRGEAKNTPDRFPDKLPLLFIVIDTANQQNLEALAIPFFYGANEKYLFSTPSVLRACLEKTLDTLENDIVPQALASHRAHKDTIEAAAKYIHTEYFAEGFNEEDKAIILERVYHGDVAPRRTAKQMSGEHALHDNVVTRLSADLEEAKFTSRSAPTDDCNSLSRYLKDPRLICYSKKELLEEVAETMGIYTGKDSDGKMHFSDKPFAEGVQVLYRVAHVPDPNFPRLGEKARRDQAERPGIIATFVIVAGVAFGLGFLAGQGYKMAVEKGAKTPPASAPVSPGR